jgi:hypothetical protein
LVASTDAPTLWHRRLGHPGYDLLRRLASSLPCHKEIKGPSPCHACQLGRHVRLPFSDSTSRTLRPFELVHCDLWTSPVESMSGYKYFLVILDDFTLFYGLFHYDANLKPLVFSLTFVRMYKLNLH